MTICSWAPIATHQAEPSKMMGTSAEKTEFIAESVYTQKKKIREVIPQTQHQVKGKALPNLYEWHSPLYHTLLSGLESCHAYPS